MTVNNKLLLSEPWAAAGVLANGIDYYRTE